MLKVTVMALAAAFYGKKGSALQTHFKDLFQKISPRRPSIPCTKPVEADFCMQPKEIHPSYSCKSWRNRRQACFPSSNALNSPVSALPAWVDREAPLDFCWPVHLLTAGGSGPCHIYSLAKSVLQHPHSISQAQNAGVLGFVQHLVAVIASRSELGDVLQNNDFQMLLETRLWYILSKICQVPLCFSRLWYK